MDRNQEQAKIDNNFLNMGNITFSQSFQFCQPKVNDITNSCRWGVFTVGQNVDQMLFHGYYGLIRVFFLNSTLILFTSPF